MENLREACNSKMDEQCVKPQTWDQSKRVRVNKEILLFLI